MTVFLVLTRNGFDDLVDSFRRVPSPIWVNKDVLLESEADSHREDGARVQRHAAQTNHDEERGRERVEPEVHANPW